MKKNNLQNKKGKKKAKQKIRCKNIYGVHIHDQEGEREGDKAGSARPHQSTLSQPVKRNGG